MHRDIRFSDRSWYAQWFSSSQKGTIGSHPGYVLGVMPLCVALLFKGITTKGVYFNLRESLVSKLLGNFGHVVNLCLVALVYCKRYIDHCVPE